MTTVFTHEADDDNLKIYQFDSQNLIFGYNFKAVIINNMQVLPIYLLLYFYIFCSKTFKFLKVNNIV